jgi:hypothetical protein
MIKLLSIMALLLSTPTISQVGDTSFKTEFDRGAVWACTVFRQVEPIVNPTESDLKNWPDGHYAPRSCGDLDPHWTAFTAEWSPYIFNPQTGKDYDTDWEIYTEIGYPSGNNVVYVESNRIKFHR